MDWAWLQALNGLLASPSVRLPRVVGASDVDQPVTDQDGVVPWVPLAAPFPSILPPWADLEFQWTAAGSDGASRWVEAPWVRWSPSGDPGTVFVPVGFVIRAVVYATDPRSPSRHLMGVMRLVEPVAMADSGSYYDHLPRWPVRSAVREG